MQGRQGEGGGCNATREGERRGVKAARGKGGGSARRQEKEARRQGEGKRGARRQGEGEGVCRGARGIKKRRRVCSFSAARAAMHH